MANYPSKPWTHGQTAEIYPDTMFRYDSDQGLWTQLLNLPYDSDYTTETNILQNYALSNSASILALIQKSGQFELNVARGLEPGMRYVHKFGVNTDIDTSTVPEDIWGGGGPYTGQPTTGSAETVTLTSSSGAADSELVVTVYGLDSDYLEINETVTLSNNGTATSTKKFWRLNKVKVNTPAPGQVSNVGEITVAHSVTTANVFAQVHAGDGQTNIACWTVPAGKTAYLKRVLATLIDAQVSVLNFYEVTDKEVAEDEIVDYIIVND